MLLVHGFQRKPRSTYVQEELLAVHTGHETVHGHSVMVIVVGVETAQVLPP